MPANVELDLDNTELCPGVRRMLAPVGQDAPFNLGRQQMKLLADLEVTTKAVERTAEAMGEDTAVRERHAVGSTGGDGEPIPIVYVELDGKGVPVVNSETVGRQGKTEGQPARTGEAKLGCVFTQTKWDEQGYPIRDPRVNDLYRPRRASYCRSVARPLALVGSGAQTGSEPGRRAEMLDHESPGHAG